MPLGNRTEADEGSGAATSGAHAQPKPISTARIRAPAGAGRRPRWIKDNTERGLLEFIEALLDQLFLQFKDRPEFFIHLGAPLFQSGEQLAQARRVFLLFDFRGGRLEGLL